MFETGERQKFIVGENVMIKNFTTGIWDEATVVSVFPHGVNVMYKIKELSSNDINCRFIDVKNFSREISSIN